MLRQLGAGFGLVGLAGVLADADARGATVSSDSPLSVKPTHFPARAKRVIHLFMNGGPSQVDTFDPKPALAKWNGKPYAGDAKVGSNGRPIGHLMQSPFEINQLFEVFLRGNIEQQGKGISSFDKGVKIQK